MSHQKKPWLKKSGNAEGVATVEFAIILTVLLMLVTGILEFGYDWYVKTALANASRDGARWGTIYKTAGGTRIAPSQFAANNFKTIQQVVDAYLTSMLPSGTTWTTTVSGAGYATPYDASANPNPLTVKVSLHKNWSAMGNLLPSLHLDNMNLSASTTMMME